MSHYIDLGMGVNMILDLVLAIFGGGYYAGKYIHDKGKDMRRDRQTSERINRWKMFVNQYRLSSDPFFTTLAYQIKYLKGDFQHAADDKFSVFEEYRKDLEYIFDRKITTKYLYINYSKQLAMLISADKGKLSYDMTILGGGYVIHNDEGRRLVQLVEEKFNKATGENIRLVAHNGGYIIPEQGYGAGLFIAIDRFVAEAMRPCKRLW